MTTGPAHPRATQETRSLTFEALVAGREKEFPVLARAVAESRPAISTKIEWLIGERPNRKLKYNYTQIVRHPYTTDGVEEGSNDRGGLASLQEATTLFLSAVEQILIDGKPYWGINNDLRAPKRVFELPERRKSVEARRRSVHRRAAVCRVGKSAERGNTPPSPVQRCGGYRHYLRRKRLRDTDLLRLRPFREPILFKWTEGGKQMYEWLAEFSLQVS